MDARRITFTSHRGVKLGPYVVSAYQYNATLGRKQARNEHGETVYDYREGNVQFTDLDDRIHRLDLDSIMHTLVEKVNTAGPQ